MDSIYHIVSKAAWQAAQTAGRYEGDTLHTEGFIHCSKRDQFMRVANARFQGRTDLLLLEINPELLKSELRVEESEPGNFYPHIYGALNLDAVIRAMPFEFKAHFIDPVIS